MRIREKGKKYFSLGIIVQQKNKRLSFISRQNQKCHLNQGVINLKCVQLAEEGNPNATLRTFCLRTEKCILCPRKGSNWVLEQNSGGSFSKGAQKNRNRYKVKVLVLWSKQAYDKQLKWNCELWPIINPTQVFHTQLFHYQFL